MAALQTSLPPKDADDIKLVVATEAELLAQQHANSVEWRGVLSEEAYVRRELLLYDQDLTRGGGLTPWLLVHDPPNGPRQVLCGCESIRKKALVAKDGAVKDVIAHGVASVFCPPANRGRGYAGRMMAEVNQRLKEWQAADGLSPAMSVLYSDIGREFYALRGWQPFPSSHLALSVLQASETANTNPAIRDLPATVLLGSSDLPALCAVDERLIRQRVARTQRPGQTSVAVIPDSWTMDWHHARERFVASETLGRMPSDVGAMVGQHEGERIWCYWARVWTNPNEHEPHTMHILRLVVENEQLHDAADDADEASPLVRATAALLARARSIAGEWGMQQVQMWNPSVATMAAAKLLEPDCKVHDRDTESIASLLWYGDERWQDVQWVCNEKYGWC